MLPRPARLSSPPFLLDLLSHRDARTAAAVLTPKLSGSPAGIRSRLVALAAEFDAAGCPAMARRALDVANAIEA